MLTWFVIAAAGKQRTRGMRGYVRTILYIKKCQFKTSDTSSVVKVTSTRDKSEAQKFGKLTALQISEALNGPRWGLKTYIEAIQE